MVGINRDCIIYQIIDQLKKCQIKIENNKYNDWEQEMQNLYYELSINESDVVTRYNY